MESSHLSNSVDISQKGGEERNKKKENLLEYGITYMGIKLRLTKKDRTIITLLGYGFAIYLVTLGQVMPAIATWLIVWFWVSK